MSNLSNKQWICRWLETPRRSSDVTVISRKSLEEFHWRNHGTFRNWGICHVLALRTENPQSSEVTFKILIHRHRYAWPKMSNAPHFGSEIFCEYEGWSILLLSPLYYTPLQWRHNEHDGVSNHQPHDCLLNHLFRRRSKKTSKLRFTSLCAGNSLGTGEFPAQMASYAENISIWWRHHAILCL